MPTLALPPLALPDGNTRVLIHSCCAPCVGAILARFKEVDIDCTIYFFNPNIHPQKEYLLRKEENKRYADKLKMPFVDADYTPKKWYALVQGLEQEPERGLRCNTCFFMRFQALATYAHDHGFSLVTSSLAISRWKNRAQINAYGHKAVQAYEGIKYWDYNWRKHGGSAKMIQLSKTENFYQQQYCGCAYSLRDTNAFRKRKGLSPLVLGSTFYGETKP